jgi:hypothetical protein
MRKEQGNAARFGTDRFFQIHEPQGVHHSGWYYESREGVQGPFSNRELAELSLMDLIAAKAWNRADSAPA